MVEGVEVDLSTGAIYAEAATQLAGIPAYEDDGVNERLGLLCQAINEDKDLSRMGRFSLFTTLARYLVQRSRLEDLYKRHPEINEVEITAPIIITGLPRSGTTHLLNLVSADHLLRSLQYWESLEPFPGADHKVNAGEEDPRVQRCRDQLAFREEIIPLFPAMHDMQPHHIHEEIELLALDFSTSLFEQLAQIPRWTRYYLAHDQAPHYEFLKRALKALQWTRGPDRWLLKSPQHLEQLGTLIKVFPDAKVIITHRDPASIMASLMTMVAYSGRLTRDPVRPHQIGQYFCDRMIGRLQRLVETRHLIPAAQSIDVMFHEFMHDNLGTVEKIYQMAGLPLIDSVRNAMSNYAGENSRGRYGQIVYDMKGDFGIDPEVVREKLQFYYDNFPIKIGE